MQHRTERLLLLMLLIGTLVSRIPFRASVPYGLDSIQFVLAVSHYDVRLHQPHPPGYFLFVMLGRLSSIMIGDPNLSFIVVNIIFSLLSVGLVFLLGKDLFGQASALASALLLATSPVFWFHGEVALSNMVDCFCVLLLAWLCWKNLAEQHRFLYLSAFVLAVAGGVRQNTLLFFLPLWLISIRGCGLKRMFFGVLLMGTSAACWYLPMARLSGGIAAYQTAVRDHWLNSNWHGLTLEWLPFNVICVGYFILLGIGLGTVILFLTFLFWLQRNKPKELLKSNKVIFFAAWMLPSLAFFVFIYSHPIQTGHSLIYLPALVLLLPPSISIVKNELTDVFASGGRKKRATGRGEKGRPERLRTISQMSGLGLGCWAATVLLAVCSTLVFLFFHTAVSRRSLKEYESRVADMQMAIRSRCSPTETILLNDDFMFLGFRDLMFHLPEYRSYQPRIYSLNGEPLLFSGFQRQTRLLRTIEVPREVRHFVINADEFRRNPELMNPGLLQSAPGREYLQTPTGASWLRADVRDLPIFFPRVHFVFL